MIYLVTAALQLIGQVPMPGDDREAWMLGVLASAIAALAGALAYVWRMFVSRWNDCEKGHAETNERLIKVSTEVGELRGKIEVLQHLNGVVGGET